MGVFDVFNSPTPATSTVNSAPWLQAQPFLTDLMNQGRINYQSGVGQNYFPGSTVVPFSNQTNTALGMREARAVMGSPVTRAAQTQATRTLGGDFLDPTKNPAYGVMADDVTNRVNSAFGLAGRTGSPAHQASIARGITQGGAAMYDQERARQMQSLGLAGPVGQMDLQDSDLLAMTGAQREAQAAQQIDDLMKRFQFGETAPWQALQNYAGSLSGAGGGTTTTTDVAGRNRLLEILSGATGGGALAGQGGAAIGALLGLLG